VYDLPYFDKGIISRRHLISEPFLFRNADFTVHDLKRFGFYLSLDKLENPNVWIFYSTFVLIMTVFSCNGYFSPMKRCWNSGVCYETALEIGRLL